jgi:hypothetical protein
MRWKIALCTVVLAVGVFAQTRPRSAFVFRTAINEGSISIPSFNKNRLVGVLLAPGFTALYSTENGGLYQVRSGTANNGNDTYSHTQFGQVLTFAGSTVYHRNTATAIWELLANGSPVASKTVYKGFTLTGNLVWLRYAIQAGSTTINIHEKPEYVSGTNPGLQRVIMVSGLEPNQSLRLRLTGQSGTVRPETWSVTLGGTLEGSNPQYLVIPANGAATVIGTWVP